MNTQIDRAIQGAALQPLSKEQKRALVLLARKAFERSDLKSQMSFEDWRHHQQLLCVERASLTACTNEDFNFLRSHYLALLGQSRAAESVRAAACCEPRTWALTKLRKECEAAEDVIAQPWPYVQAIARSRFKGAQIEDLAEKQVWSLIFDIRRNAQRRRRQT